jgi:hypothetical protein
MKLQLLESFEARGTDGARYKVKAYEQLLRVDLAADGRDHWESTGLSEYRLASGERVDVAPDGAMRIVATGVGLHPARSEPAPDAARRPTR